MSDALYNLSIDKLFLWMKSDFEKNNQIFGVHRSLFFTPKNSDAFRIKRYEELLETPIGVAAGPHTQLAQNIITAWLCGARYIELKTIQTLDKLEVTKPCIDMTDEGYNCEWSQELELNQSFDAYCNAWILIHILKHKFGWQSENRGFIFNMSVGYNFEGIQAVNVQNFIDKMEYCPDEIEKRVEKLRKHYPEIDEVEISPHISNNVTLSTMHGCPSDEIEKIASYFLEKRHLHTTVKLNPTLLGASQLREILNERLGYDVYVPDEAFEHDPSYHDAVELIHSLQQSALTAGVCFNVKLTNTLEIQNTKNNLPMNEKMIYLSGRALHPISINVAAKLQNDFNGKLDISFSAGADCFNVSDILACGIKPITVCSDLLKPGGYTRLYQYLTEIDNNIKAVEANDITEFILKRNENNSKVSLAKLENLNSYSKVVLMVQRYKKSIFPYENIKTARQLKKFDCIQAPCSTKCPVDQKVPEYMFWTAQGDFKNALDIILEDNPLPGMTGSVCDHLCQTKCTRMNIDDPLHIREIKRFNFLQNDFIPTKNVPEKHNEKVAIIGAGPSGLSCASFLARNGVSVDLFERKSFAGGMASDAIPSFRLDAKTVKHDIEAIINLGVSVHFNTEITTDSFEKLRNKYDFIYIAVGAQVSKKLNLQGEDAKGVTDQLRFLSDVRQGKSIQLGRKVALIGGGNACMDAARTANRLVGHGGEVTVYYRRTKKEMPADLQEVQSLIEEGISLRELTAPEKLITENGRISALILSEMKLGKIDESGRPHPEKIAGSEFKVSVNSIISAIGQNVKLDFLPNKTLQVDPITMETQYSNVFAGGDALRGASTLIKAIGDGKNVANKIIEKISLTNVSDNKSFHRDYHISIEEHQKRLAKREFSFPLRETDLSQRKSFSQVAIPMSENEARKEAQRCLSCDQICNICVSVCPNRANVSFPASSLELPILSISGTLSNFEQKIEGMFSVTQPYQVFNYHEFCNECGNCATFCPTNDAPYLVKPRIFLDKNNFLQEKNGFFMQNGTLLANFNGNFMKLTHKYDKLYFEKDNLTVVLNVSEFSVIEIQSDKKNLIDISLRELPEMYFILKTLIEAT